MYMTTYITICGATQHKSINLHGYILSNEGKLIAQNQALERMNRAGAAQRLAVSIAQDIVSASVLGTNKFANEFANSEWCEASLLNESKIQGQSRPRHGRCHERSM
jgi:hypothetical protein